MVEVNYSGTAAHHLPVYDDGRSINRFNGDLIVNKGTLTRLNPNFGAINYAWDNGNSAGNYGSAVATRRFAHNYALRGIYTVGKALDETSQSGSLDSGAITTTTTVIQSQNIPAQRGRADFSIHQQFSADGTSGKSGSEGERDGPHCLSIGDQFMFGPAFLPGNAPWYDFWTGETTKGGGEIKADAPLDRMPLYVREGSILPMGPEIEYADQDPAGPVELRIYGGADAEFDLYQDAGDGYAYERGERALIPMHWDDKTSILTIGARQGSYPGMPSKMDFHVVLVGKGHGAGEAVTAEADRTISYNGKETTAEVRR